MRTLSPFFNYRSPSADIFADFEKLFAEPNQSYMASQSEVHEEENHFLISVDLPGVKKEDVNIELTEGLLSISGERKHRASEAGSWKFNKKFTIPRSIDRDQVQANFENGVLELYLPKLKSAQTKKIEIQTNRESFFSRLLGSSDAPSKQ